MERIRPYLAEQLEWKKNITMEEILQKQRALFKLITFSNTTYPCNVKIEFRVVTYVRNLKVFFSIISILS